MDWILSLSWAGIQLQDRCFVFLLIELVMQKFVLHVDREQVAHRRKGKHVFVFKCLQILTIY